MVVEVLGPEVVDIEHAHPRREVGVPPGRHVHAPGQAPLSLGGEAPLQSADDGVQQGRHGTRGQQASRDAGTEVVDRMEGSAPCVEAGGEALAVTDSAERAYQGKQRPHDSVAEDHVEQQFPVRPTRPVRQAAQVGGRRLLADLVRVHATASVTMLLPPRRARGTLL